MVAKYGPRPKKIKGPRSISRCPGVRIHDPGATANKDLIGIIQHDTIEYNGF